MNNFAAKRLVSLRPTDIAIQAVSMANLPQEKVNVGASVAILVVVLGLEPHLVVL